MKPSGKLRISPTKIRANDFPPENKDLVESMGAVLNPFFDKVVANSSNTFTLDDIEFRTLDMKVDANGVPLQNSTVQTKLKNFFGFICVNAQDTNNTGILPTSCPFLITEFSNSTVTIRKITGLPQDITYRLFLVGISE